MTKIQSSFFYLGVTLTLLTYSIVITAFVMDWFFGEKAKKKPEII